MSEKIVGMNIDLYIEMFGSQGCGDNRMKYHDFYVVYHRSTKKIVYHGQDAQQANDKTTSKHRMIKPLVKSRKLNKNFDPRLAFPSGFGLGVANDPESLGV